VIAENSSLGVERVSGDRFLLNQASLDDFSFSQSGRIFDMAMNAVAVARNGNAGAPFESVPDWSELDNREAQVRRSWACIVGLLRRSACRWLLKKFRAHRPSRVMCRSICVFELIGGAALARCVCTL